MQNLEKGVRCMLVAKKKLPESSFSNQAKKQRLLLIPTRNLALHALHVEVYA
jgi:hypothetical protein